MWRYAVRMTKERSDITIVCPSCNKPALAKIAGENSYYYDEVNLAGRHIFASCPICDSPLVFHQEWEAWDDEAEIAAPRIIYPTDSKQFGGQIPASVKVAFEEAEACFKAGAHTAAPLMCRRCLEAIAHDQGATGNGLAGKIKSLEQKGILTKEFVDWFDMLRQVGNQAAHDVAGPVSMSDAKDTLDFTHAILEFIYTYRQRFEEFKLRRVKAPPASAASVAGQP